SGRPSAPRCTSTAPIASVLTSAQSPPTSGTMAPSALRYCTADPLGAGGRSRSSRSSSAVCSATYAAPAAWVCRRTVPTDGGAFGVALYQCLDQRLWLDSGQVRTVSAQRLEPGGQWFGFCD